MNAAAKATLSKIVPALQGLQQTKVVVNGYTDNLPIGPELKAQGIADNLDLSSRRADGVVEYLASQGVNQNLLSGARVRRDQPDCLQRHCRGTG